MNVTVKRAQDLKEELVDFVYDAEGELAVALETYAAENSSRERHDIQAQNMMIDSFILSEKVGEKTPLELFLEETPDLTPEEQQLLKSWEQSFIGLFEVLDTASEHLKLMNWLTAKSYPVLVDTSGVDPELARLKPGEIILARIAPYSGQDWILLGSSILKGKLGFQPTCG